MRAFRVRSSMRRRLLASACGAAVLLLSACGSGRSPNIVLIVWDTVRADRLGLYGYGKPTTPFLDQWAGGARVYEDCVSPANYTVASHASLFTGRLPTEHGVRNGAPVLPETETTLAELLKDAGYRTLLYSANPRITRETGFAQGFDTADHPWSEKLRGEAYQLVLRKVASKSRSSELDYRVRSGIAGPWEVKASGELAARTVLRWLNRIDRKRPFFIFLNYMEAHKPRIPPEEYRSRFLSPERVDHSYEIDTRWGTVWDYAYGLGEYDEEELAVLGGTYDAAIAELDDLARGLIGMLGREGYLKNTVIVLTSDHGEHLGEKHLLGHEHSLFEPLVRVPLLIYAPSYVEPGREKGPVMTQDLFGTLLEVAGIEPPVSVLREASLLAPAAGRARLSECTGLFDDAFEDVLHRHPDWDPTPWRREIRALTRGGEKLIRWSDGETRLYRVAEDPGERDDRATRDAETARALGEILDGVVASLVPASPSTEPAPVLSAEQREMLRSLGYLREGADSNETGRE